MHRGQNNVLLPLSISEQSKPPIHFQIGITITFFNIQPKQETPQNLSAWYKW